MPDEAEDRAAVQADKERRIKAEKTRLCKFLADVDKETLKGVDKLISRAAFLAVTLEDLEDDINRNGFESEYQNGENQWGTKQSPSVASHVSFTRGYLATMKQLLDLRPEGLSGDGAKAGDAIRAYINR